MPGDEEAGVTREWVAILPTVLKASTAYSGDLPAHEKLAVPAGARLTARLTGQSKEYWIIADGQVDGVAIADNLRYVYRLQWKIQGAEDPPRAEVLPAESLPPIQPSIAARPPHHRRLYAAFRRRLSEPS